MIQILHTFSASLLFLALFGVLHAEDGNAAVNPEELINDIENSNEEGKSSIEQLVDLICTCREEEAEEEITSGVINPLNPYPLPRDCYDILNLGQSASGRYDIYPNDSNDPVRVWCDMETDEGGWTVLQRREDGSVDFYRNWHDYKKGFGAVTAEHWLGNDNIHLITLQRAYALRVDMKDFDGESRYATYDHFRIGDEHSEYMLFLGAYEGTAGDSLKRNDLQSFSTKDADNDISATHNCARDFFTGGWWYEQCSSVNLNGQYLRGDLTDEQRDKGVTWDDFRTDKYSLKFTEMKVRPVKRNKE